MCDATCCSMCSPQSSTCPHGCIYKADTVPESCAAGAGTTIEEVNCTSLSMSECILGDAQTQCWVDNGLQECRDNSEKPDSEKCESFDSGTCITKAGCTFWQGKCANSKTVKVDCTSLVTSDCILGPASTQCCVDYELQKCRPTSECPTSTTGVTTTKASNPGADTASTTDAVTDVSGSRSIASIEMVGLSILFSFGTGATRW